MSASEERLPSYGGQAVIEGVLMRGTRFIAMAMRAPDGSIALHEETLGGIYTSSWMKIPFLRGLVGLWDALAIGIRFLTISANTQTGENEKLEGSPTLPHVGFITCHWYWRVFPCSRWGWPTGGNLVGLERVFQQSARRGSSIDPAHRLYLGYRIHARYSAGISISWCRA